MPVAPGQGQCGRMFRMHLLLEGLSLHFIREFKVFALLRMLFKPVGGAYGQAGFSKVCCVRGDELGMRNG